MNIFSRLDIENKIKKRITLDMPHEKVIQISMDETINEFERSPIRHSIFGTMLQTAEAPELSIPRDRAEKLKKILAKNKKYGLKMIYPGMKMWRGKASKKFKRIWWKKMLGTSLFDFILMIMDSYPKRIPCPWENVLSHIELDARDNGYDVLKIKNWEKKVYSTYRWCKSKRRDK